MTETQQKSASTDSVNKSDLTEKQKLSLLSVSCVDDGDAFSSNAGLNEYVRTRTRLGGSRGSREEITWESLADRDLIVDSFWLGSRNYKVGFTYTEQGRKLAREIAKDYIKKGKIDADDVDFEWDSEEQTEIMASMI